MNAVTFFLDHYFYLHIKLSFPCCRAEKVPYQARMCVKDSFVKCWQQPQQALPSQSSPPTPPGAHQGSQHSLSWVCSLLAGLCPGSWDTQERGRSANAGTSPPLAPERPAGAAPSLCSPYLRNWLPRTRGVRCVHTSQHPTLLS